MIIALHSVLCAAPPSAAPAPGFANRRFTPGQGRHRCPEVRRGWQPPFIFLQYISVTIAIPLHGILFASDRMIAPCRERRGP
jgi:hypothetical protein